MTHPRIVAHRGNSSLAPENTLAAFVAAVRAGADAIEIDIRAGSDGEAVVIHDADVARTTSGSGPVADLDVEELARLDAGAWFDGAFAGQRVPLLVDVLEFLTVHTGVDLLLEAKGPWVEEPLTRALDSIVACGLTERVVLQSFDVETLTSAAELAPDLRRELLVWDPQVDLRDAVGRTGVGGVNPAGPLLARDPALVGRLRELGIRVTPWTLNEPADWALALAAGVDGIITDRPDRLAGWLAAQR